MNKGQKKSKEVEKKKNICHVKRGDEGGTLTIGRLPDHFSFSPSPEKLRVIPYMGSGDDHSPIIF